MILQALSEYYKRQAANDLFSIAPKGFEEKEIPFVLVLDRQGNIFNLESTCESEGKSERAKKFLVPQAVNKTNNISSNLLWENPEYALGISRKSNPKKVSERRHAEFIKKVNSLQKIEDEGLEALKLFLAKPNKLELLEEKAKTDKSFDGILKKLLEKSLYMTFRLKGNPKVILESNVIKEKVKSLLNFSDKKNNARCLITGEKDSIKRVHPPIKGIFGGESSGGRIVSFNERAYYSYGKEQGYNAPVGENAVFYYTTALNRLLSKDSNQKIQVGEDVSTVFWASESSGKEFEKIFYNLFYKPYKDNPDKGTEAVKSLFKSVEKGVSNVPDGDNEFYVLGVSPNTTRISVRFWVKSTIRDIACNIKKHFEDLKIDKPSYENEFLPLSRLLVSTAVQGKKDNIASHLAGSYMRAILKDLPYPNTLLQSVINRIKSKDYKAENPKAKESEIKSKYIISYPRVALIKAYLNRLARKNNKEEEIKVSLNTNYENQGYVLGRLFATLEKVQEEAQGGINSTIMRYYASASSTPIFVFSALMRLYRHHLEKLGKEKIGRKIYFDKLVTEIEDKIDNKKGYPPYLSLEDQGKFSIGYYQQRQKFFTKKENIDE